MIFFKYNYLRDLWKVRANLGSKGFEVKISTLMTLMTNLAVNDIEISNLLHK